MKTLQPKHVTSAAIDSLVHHIDSPSVSLILPLDRRHPDDRGAHLQLKRLIAVARAQLQSASTPDVDALLEPAEALLRRKVIAEHSGGLALFLSPGLAAELYLDTPVEPLACTGDRFTVGPLLASIDSGPACYVLTVGAENIALFRARRSGWIECDVPDLPRSEKDALWYERDERMSSSHAGGPTGASGMSIISHGSGAQDEDRKEQLQRFFLKVDHAVVHFLLEDPEAALVVAGTAPSVARYKQISRHHRLIAAAVGSPEELTMTELKARVEPMIESLLDEDDDAPVARLRERLGTGLASADLADIANAAEQGRVSDLFVASTTPRWRVPGESNDLRDEWQLGATDLVNVSICEAWRHGASMHCVSSQRLPSAVPIAAMYRF